MTCLKEIPITITQALEQPVVKESEFDCGNCDPIVQQFEGDPPEQPWGYGKSLLDPFIRFTFMNDWPFRAVRMINLI